MIRLDREIEAKYEVLAKMGEGGFGSVYKVRHKVFQEIRVIKTAKYPASETAERTRFITEAKRGYHFRHEGIARVLDFEITSEGTAYIAMEFIDGMNLRELFTVSRSLMEPARVIDIALQTLDALGYLHERGVVHRDISPDNLMLTRGDAASQRIKLIDLGIAKSMEGSQSLTLDGRFIGKVSYASPEQFSGTADQRSDLYSLGVVMYELLTGARPIKSTDPRAIMAAHLMGELRSFDDVDPAGRVSPDLRAVVTRALQRDPAKRFQNAAELASALQAAKNPVPYEKTVSVQIPAEDVAAMQASRSEQIAWDAAIAADSPKAWETFLARYGSSPRAKAAKARLDELEQNEETDWNAAASADTEESWQHYLAKHADAPRAARARRRLEKIEAEHAEQDAFNVAAANDSVVSWQRFLSEYEDSARAGEARDRLVAAREREEDTIAWNDAVRAATSAAWNDYIARHSRSPRIDAAREALAEVLEREIETADFDHATRAGSIDVWQSFIVRHPRGPRLDYAREQLQLLRTRADEDAAWSHAAREDTSDAWREYLRVWSNSDRHAEAQRNLSAAQQREIEDRDWFEAGAADTVEAWRRFLNAHAGSGRAGAARERLAAAEHSAAEEAAWIDAVASPTSGRWAAFLQRFPNSHRREQAERHRADAERDEALARAFADADAAGTAQAWKDFLARHDRSRFDAEARKRLGEAEAREREQQAFADAERADSVETWSNFARRYPNSARAATARERLVRARRREEAARHAEEAERAAAECDAALRTGTIDALEQYLSRHGESAQAPEIRKRLDALRTEKARLENEAAERTRRKAEREAAEERAWSAVVENGAIPELETFVSAWPDSQHVADARKKIELLRTRERDAAIAAEERAWRAATKRGNVTNLRTFMSAYPKSAHAAEAHNRIEAIAQAEREEARERAVRVAARAKTAPARRLALSIAAGITVVASGVGYWMMHRTSVAPAKPPATVAAARQSAAMTATMPPPLQGSGQLIVNVFPWGEIVSIKDAATQREQLKSHPVYTPAVIPLPPGRYTITLANPNAKKPISRDVTIASSQSARVEEKLDTVDAAEYLRSLPQTQ
jgi:serine/threonine protein kinase/outer membrane protein assembly factor BamD (BamD/ComL family)